MTDKPNVACSDALMGIFGHQRSKNPVEIINGIPHDLQPNGTYRRRAETAKYEANVGKARKDAPKEQQGRQVTDVERSLCTFLLDRQISGEVSDIHLVNSDDPPPAIRIGFRCTYTPDAICFNRHEDCYEIWEAKNAWVKQKDDGGWVKLKTCAQMCHLWSRLIQRGGLYDGELHPQWERMIKKGIAFYLYEEGKDRQIWIKHIPPIDGAAKKKRRP